MILFTIGHSNHSLEEFLKLLQTHSINCVADVRSLPASSHNPQFNREVLELYLPKNGIEYQYFGKEFGARRLDSINKDGQVDFEQAINTSLFQKGVDRMNCLLTSKNVALMCSEANPLECHRFAMVSRYFFEHGVNVQHIVHDENGAVTTIPHQTLQDEMVKEYVRKKKIPEVQPPDMFGENECTKEQQIVLAYRQKNKEIAYQQETEEYYV